MTREQIEKLIEYRDARLQRLLDVKETATSPTPELVEDITNEEATIAAMRRLLAVMPRTGPVPEDVGDVVADMGTGDVGGIWYEISPQRHDTAILRWVPASAIFPKDEVKP